MLSCACLTSVPCVGADWTADKYTLADVMREVSVWDTISSSSAFTGRIRHLAEFRSGQVKMPKVAPIFCLKSSLWVECVIWESDCDAHAPSCKLQNFLKPRKSLHGPEIDRRCAVVFVLAA